VLVESIKGFEHSAVTLHTSALPGVNFARKLALWRVPVYVTIATFTMEATLPKVGRLIRNGGSPR
jgi:hypothetical protein